MSAKNRHKSGDVPTVLVALGDAGLGGKFALCPTYCGRPWYWWEVCPLPYVLWETQVQVGSLLPALPALESTDALLDYG